MGMDEVHNVMNIFTQELEEFNESVKISFDDLKQNHDAVSPIWDDSMRKEYDSKWLSLEERIEQYIGSEGNSYVEVLIEKIEAIKGYLYGS
ncbi:hypothetical protein DF185_00140 [Marinifilum breve]|uniref:WXG100 family type VII secretion target n=2 Tax=Marinifilaceae TaxID=1573805 RepID=A0A2V4A1D0_9BACT|nr:hypothetical protein [Marinifilum flexuosum]PXY02539.1 hypothetical protein DF185_00140 [Marinifilum breve]